MPIFSDSTEEIMGYLSVCSLSINGSQIIGWVTVKINNPGNASMRICLRLTTNNNDIIGGDTCSTGNFTLNKPGLIKMKTDIKGFIYKNNGLSVFFSSYTDLNSSVLELRFSSGLQENEILIA